MFWSRIVPRIFTSSPWFHWHPSEAEGGLVDVEHEDPTDIWVVLRRVLEVLSCRAKDPMHLPILLLALWRAIEAHTAD